MNILELHTIFDSNIAYSSCKIAGKLKVFSSDVNIGSEIEQLTSVNTVGNVGQKTAWKTITPNQQIP